MDQQVEGEKQVSNDEDSVKEARMKLKLLDEELTKIQLERLCLHQIIHG